MTGTEPTITQGTLQNQATATIIALPLTSLLSESIPDAEHIPIYPGAKLTGIEHRSVRHNAAGYEVTEQKYEVRRFYEEKMLLYGWVPTGTSSQGSLTDYVWTVPTEPSKTAPWHLRLQINLGRTLEDDATYVGLVWGRYPDLGEGFPMYPDYTQIQTTHFEQPTTDELYVSPRRVTKRSYVSDTSPQEIAHFYNSSMLEFGWSFFYPDRNEYSSTQTGDISSPKGISFHAVPLTPDSNTALLYDAHIKANVRQDGKTLVEVLIEESEILLGP